MARRNNRLDPPFPTVFRGLSDDIVGVFSIMAEHVAKFYRPTWLTNDDVINLAFNAKDVEHLLYVRPLVAQYIMHRHPEAVIEHNVFGAMPHLVLAINSDFPVVVPDYAYYNVIKPIPTASPELVTRLGTEIEIWMEQVRNITLARAVFQFLDSKFGVLTRQNIRYVFPGIVALLRRVHLISDAKNKDDEAAKWAANLATVSPAWHAPLPMYEGFDIRPALALANEVLSSFAMYPADAPPQGDVRVIVTPNKFLETHPLWPKQLVLAGL